MGGRWQALETICVFNPCHKVGLYFTVNYKAAIFRLDVMNLQEQLDLKLQQRQARETGICQVP